MKKFFLFIFYLAFCALVLVGGAAAGWLQSSDVLSGLVNQSIFNVPPRKVFRDASHLNLLILGCDETRDPRTKQILKKNARSDMMLVAQLDFEKNSIVGLSIPRDLEVDVPGHGARKINAFHDLGGKELAKQAVETILPIRIDRVIVIDYDAFKEMVDIVGGVEVFIDKKLKYTDTWGDLYVDLKPGRQVLDGEQAMGYVRVRKTDNDFGRQKRQREFLIAMKTSIEKNPRMLPRVADTSVKLFGGELSAGEMAAVMRFAQAVGPDNIKMEMLPIRERSTSTNLDIDYTAANEVLTRLGLLRNTP